MYKKGEQFLYKKTLNTSRLRDICRDAVQNQSVLTALEDQDGTSILCSCSDFDGETINIQVKNITPLIKTKEEIELALREGRLSDEQYLDSLLRISN